MSQQIATDFLQQYYQSMMNNRAALINFYSQTSVLCYERQVYTGLEQITGKFKKFTFGQIQYHFDEFDVQPSPIAGGMLIMIVGTIQMDQEMPMKFAQTFQIVPNQQGGLFISNDIFRFVM